MHTKITLRHLMSTSKSQRPIMVTSLALLSMALLLIYSLAAASPTQPFTSAGGPSAVVGGPVGSSSSSSSSTSLAPSQEPKGIFKRSFAGLGCLGVYDKAKFARLDRVCEECYTLYREPDIHSSCRQDCFRNTVFTRCVDALLLSHEAKKFDEMVDELYGK